MLCSGHDVEDGEQFAHGGDEGHHFGFAPLEELLVERPKARVVLRGDESRHEQRVPEGDASAAGGSFAAERAAVAIGGSHADQSRDLLAVELPEFRQFRQENTDGGGSNSGNGAQQLGLRLQFCVLFDQRGDAFVEGEPLLLVQPQGLVDHAADLLVDGGAKAVLFLDEHVPHLSPTAGEVEQFSAEFVERRRDAGLHPCGELRDAAGIEGVGFGELIGGPREVANLPRVDDGHVEAACLEVLDERSFESSGSFETDELRGVFFEECDETIESRG